jgi:hypothetical protein
MDELELIRALRPDPGPLQPGTRERAALRLRQAITTEAPQGRPTWRRRARSMLIAAVAGATIVIGAITLLPPGGGSGPTTVQLAEAAPVLQRAALQARSDPGLTWRDDQYLYTRERMIEIPLDPRAKTLTFTNEYWRSADGSKPSRVTERGRTWTEAPFADGTVWPPRRQAALEALPTDPDRLLTAVTRWFGAGRSPAVDHETQYMGLTMLLNRELPPPLRAATFEALARIPGVEVSDRGLDANGRPGISISRPSQPGQSDTEIVLDRRTYEFLGLQQHSTRNDGTRIRLLLIPEARGVVDRPGERP